MTFGLWFAWLFHWATPQGVTFPETAENRWMFDGATRVLREEIVTVYPGCLPTTRRPPARYEEAILFHAAATSHLDLLAKAPAGINDRTRSMLLRSGDLVGFYRRVTLEFAPELVSLGVKDEPNIELIESLTERLRQWSPQRFLPFSDVPSSHWAAKSVGDLRALGMLHGYPDGQFRG